MADFARGEELRRLREERHLSQEDAAHEIGVSTKALRAWEKGGGIRWPNAQTAGKFYGVSPETLVSRELPEHDPAPTELREALEAVEELRSELRSTHLELLAEIGKVHDLQETLQKQLQRGRRGGGAKGK